MTYRSILKPAWFLLAAIIATGAQADSNQTSALVQLTHLTKGSLPRQLPAYGRVEAAASASHTVTAPASVQVAAIYVRQGQVVAKGDRLLRLQPTPATAAAYARARAALSAARDNVTRTRKLLAQHLATEQQYAAARQSAADARANLKALRTTGAGGSRILRAPFHAAVTALTTTPGAIASEGSPLLTLAGPGELVLTVGIQPAQIGAVHAGDKAAVTAIGTTRAVAGTVRMRGGAVDPATGLVPVQIGLPSGGLLPGEAAEAVITTGQAHGYVVPHAAILVDDNGNPYVVQAVDMKARIVAVDIVATRGDEDVVAGSGLNAAQPLVLSGNYQLDNGMRLRVASKPSKSPAR